jgi:hypothetical protein
LLHNASSVASAGFRSPSLPASTMDSGFTWPCSCASVNAAY